MKKPVRRGIIILIGIAIAGILVVSGWGLRVPLLQSAARAWIVSDDPMQPADAIVLLGGGVDTRPFAAADLFRRGLAKQILLSDVRQSPVEKLGVIERHRDLNRDVLLKLGIPADAIAAFGHDVSNTYEEARALRALAKSSSIRSVIIPTEIFSTRRVRWIFRRELSPIGVEVWIEAIAPLEYSAEDWWRNEQGLIGFQNEAVKYLFYRLKYSSYS
jgi:uncharacterized SAM-binding protein YcdF (DUF218 family)